MMNMTEQTKTKKHYTDDNEDIFIQPTGEKLEVNRNNPNDGNGEIAVECELDTKEHLLKKSEIEFISLDAKEEKCLLLHQCLLLH